MERKEKGWKTAQIVIGTVGAALLITILVLRLFKLDVLFLTYPLVGIVILFLVANERARMLERKRLREESEHDAEDHPTPSEQTETLPKEAFEFDEKQS